MRIVFNYYRTLLTANVAFSFVLGYIYGVWAFLISFCTFGLLLSAFFYEMYYKQRYYFYFNKGYTRRILIGYCFLGNLAIVIAFAALKYLLHL